MKKSRISFLPDKEGVSHAISAVIITATIVILVLVASLYVYQVLEQQRAMAEFECAKESILVFNDALENIAWKRQAARSARFTIEYGHLELIPDAATLTVDAKVDGSTETYSDSVGFVRYCMKIKYVNFGEGYQSYILGDEFVVTNSTKSYGRAIIKQSLSWVNITLSYRVRAMRTSVITVNSEPVNYVEIWIIKLIIDSPGTARYIGDLDLRAKCLDATTITRGPYSLTDSDADNFADQNLVIRVQLGSEPPSESTISELVTASGSGKLVINFVIANVLVTP